MFKKPFIIIGVLGFLLLIAGLLFNPSLLAKLSSTGSFRSAWTYAQIHLIGTYFMVIGIVLLFGSLLMWALKKVKASSQYLLLIAATGLAITVTAVVLSPSFIESHFSPINFLDDGNIATLKYLQLALIIFGCLVILFSLLLYRKTNLNTNRKFGWIIIVSVLIIYLIIIDRTFLKLQYPSNIITKPSEYGKVIDLLLGRDILLSDFEPRSTLVVPRKHIVKAKYPVIDINIHLNSQFQTDEDRKVLEPDNLVKSMDSVGVRIIVNTDGFSNNLERYSKQYPDRFINFYPTWFPPEVVSDDYIASLPIQLEQAYKRGARGDGEMWKYLGLKTRDSKGKILRVDDPRLDPLWEKAGELGIPFLWHMGDPAPEFLPVNRFNERFIELGRYPEWSFYGPRIASRESIMKGRENVLRKHPHTIIIGCHMGWNTDNLAYAGYLLDKYPNYFLDLSTTLSELGRQPITTRKFFIKYQDRILFGTDGGSLFNVKGWTVEKFYQAHFEFLETDDEYIKYPMQGAIDQGDWRIYGINLPDSVLQKIYYKNAEKILFKNKKNYPIQ